jgi:hypothetical protein
MPNAATAMNVLLDAEYFDFESTHVGVTIACRFWRADFDLWCNDQIAGVQP